MVLLEATRKYELNLREAIGANRKSSLKLNKLTRGGYQVAADDIDIMCLCQEYESYVRSMLSSFCLEEIPIKSELLSKVLQRWRKSEKPFSAERDVFRDAIIWTSIVEYISEVNRDHVVFISDNVKDFCNTDGIDLHPDLRRELLAKNINMQFYRSIDDFNKEFVNHANFITESWFVNNIDWATLDSTALVGLGNICCGFFFENFERRVRGFRSYDFDVVSAEFCREVNTYSISRERLGEYSVEAGLLGRCVINYFIDQPVLIPLSTYFYTSVNFEIKNEVICSWKVHYYPEDSGLCFWEAN
ncbi:protein of unknown function [Dyadobacter sp. SG02]|nr:protein of unknown function [Dyadobacter sp. SG02]